MFESASHVGLIMWSRELIIINIIFQHGGGLCSGKLLVAQKHTSLYPELFSTNWLWLVNMVQHLARQVPDISLGTLLRSQHNEGSDYGSDCPEINKTTVIEFK